MMNHQIILQIRKNFSGIVNSHNIEELNAIPNGFKNNILWNYGHIVVTQQLLLYRLSNLPLLIDNAFMDEFKKGTAPSKTYTLEDVNRIKTYAKETLEQFKTDYENNLFTSFSSYETSLGVTLNNIEEAIAFNTFHEGLHLGYVMSLRKLVTN